MTRLCTLVSGSSGNAVFLSHGGTRLLIDCGVSGSLARSALAGIGERCEDIDYILVTHEHTDHTQGVGVLSRKFDIPVIASKGTWDGMNIGKICEKNKILFEDYAQMDVGGIGVTPFDIPHDAAMPTGYRFDLGARSVAVATDLGHISDSVRAALSGCDAVLLEANYDADMLENGPYPYYLKKRIGSASGHLCNEDSGELAAHLVRCGTKQIMLGHLSKENNSETVAFATVARVLERCGIAVGRDVLMGVAPRYTSGAVIAL